MKYGNIESQVQGTFEQCKNDPSLWAASVQEMPGPVPSQQRDQPGLSVTNHEQFLTKSQRILVEQNLRLTSVIKLLATHNELLDQRIRFLESVVYGNREYFESLEQSPKT